MQTSGFPSHGAIIAEVDSEFPSQRTAMGKVFPWFNVMSFLVWCDWSHDSNVKAFALLSDETIINVTTWWSGSKWKDTKVVNVITIIKSRDTTISLMYDLNNGLSSIWLWTMACQINRYGRMDDFDWLRVLMKSGFVLCDHFYGYIHQDHISTPWR